MNDARSPFQVALHELVQAMHVLLGAQDRTPDLYGRVDAMYTRAVERLRPPRTDYGRFLEGARMQVAKASGLQKDDTLAQLGDAMGKVNTVLGDLHRAEPDGNDGPE